MKTTSGRMIMIGKAGIARGYSGYDHLIDGSELHALVGRKFRSVASALKAANREIQRTADRRVRIAPAEIMTAEGWWYR